MHGGLQPTIVPTPTTNEHLDLCGACLQPRPEAARLARPAQVRNDLAQTVQGTLFACLDQFSPAEVKLVFATKFAAAKPRLCLAAGCGWPGP
jgi:hypothetical protein